MGKAMMITDATIAKPATTLAAGDAGTCKGTTLAISQMCTTRETALTKMAERWYEGKEQTWSP
jgi:hypothetical protein